MAVGQDAFTRRNRHQRTAANRFRAGPVAGVAVGNVRLDE